MLVTLYTSRQVLQALGVEDYGIYNVVGGMVVMLSFINNAMANATQRYIAFGIAKDSVEKQRQTFSMLLNVHVLIGLILFALCEAFGLWMLYNKLVIPSEKIEDAFWILQFSIITLMFSVTQVPYNASIFGHEKMKVYTYISILEAFLKLIVAISIVKFFTDKLLVYGIMIMSVQIIIAFTYRLYCIIKFKNCTYVLFWSKKLFKELLSFTAWSLIGNLAWTLNEQGMNILINMFFGPVYNAARGVASNVSSAVTTFTTNFLSASSPQITKYYASGDYSNCIRLCNRSTKMGFFLFMLIGLPLISIIKPLLSLWLVEVPPQTEYLCMLSLLYVQTRTMGGTLQQLAHATGKIRIFQISYGTITLMAMPMVYLLYLNKFPLAAYLYVMIGITVASVLAQVISIHYIFPQYSILVYIKEVASRVLISFAFPFMLSVLLYNIEHSIISAMVSVLSVFLCTLLFVWLLGLEVKERQWIMAQIQSKLKQKS